eukprot:SAG11_NODE_1405_length_5002_cov_4.030797_3_plen_295_part_00
MVMGELQPAQLTDTKTTTQVLTTVAARRTCGTEAARRIERLKQVRAQEAAFSKRLVRERESKMFALERDAIAQAARDWQRDRAAREAQLDADYSTAVSTIGQGHAIAQDERTQAEDVARQQYWAFVRGRADEGRRYTAALQSTRLEQQNRECNRADIVDRRKAVLEIEKQRAKEAARLGRAMVKDSTLDWQADMNKQSAPLPDYTSTHLHAAIKPEFVEISATDAAKTIEKNRENTRQMNAQHIIDAQVRGKIALGKLQSEKVRDRPTPVICNDFPFDSNLGAQPFYQEPLEVN